MLPSASSVTTWSRSPSRHRTRPYRRPSDWWSFATLPTSNVQALLFGFSVWFPGFFTCLVQATPAESGQSNSYAVAVSKVAVPTAWHPHGTHPWTTRYETRTAINPGIEDSG
jgi:hypothetical protein